MNEIAPGSTFERVIEWLGRSIVAGDLQAGATLSVDDVTESTRASRSIAREATRVVAALGMIRPRRRVGLTVIGRSEWAMLEPRVVRWRLDVGDRAAQLRELAELRLAVEPAAAGLAAARISDEDALHLVALGAALRGATTKTELLEADQEFHRHLIETSQNALFTRLASTIEEALRDHTLAGPGASPEAHDLDLHVALAASVAAREPAEAEQLAREIVRRSTSAD